MVIIVKALVATYPIYKIYFQGNDQGKNYKTVNIILLFKLYHVNFLPKFYQKLSEGPQTKQAR